MHANRMMSLLPFLLLSAVIFGCFSCTPKVVVQPPAQKVAEDDFIKAEKLFEKGEHENALGEYLSFYHQNPKSPLAPAALMKAAAIYHEQGDYENAGEIYDTLIRAYPTDVFATDARLEILDLLFKQERYAELISLARDLPREGLSRMQNIRLAMMEAQSHTATNDFINAAKTYIAAYSIATPIEQNTFAERIRDVFVQLTEDDIQILLQQFEKPDEINMVLALRELTTFHNNVIGCLLPLSGPYRAIGQRALKGMALAYHQWHLNHPASFRIVIRDTGSDQDTTVLAFRELLDEKVACVIGPVITADIAAQMAQEQRIPMIALTQKPSIPQTGDYVFRNFITPEMQVRALIAHAMDVKGARRFAVLYPKEKYGITFMNEFWDAVLERNGEVVGVEAYDVKEKDFTDPVKKLVGLYYDIPQDLKTSVVEHVSADKVVENNLEILFNSRYFADAAYLSFQDRAAGEVMDSHPQRGETDDRTNPIVDFDALFIPDSPDKIAMIAPQLPYYNVGNVLLLGPNIWHSNDLIQMARFYVQGAVVSEGFFDDSRFQKVQDFIGLFKNIHNENPGYIEAVSYDTAQLVMNILSQENYQRRSDIQNALIHLRPFDGVTGLTRFDADGEVVKKLFMLEVKGGGFVELDQ